MYKGKQYEGKFFKSICYTMNGENIYDLMPYIAFVVTFLIDASPFKFMSTYYEAQGFTFLSILNEHLMKGYLNLGKDLGINIGAKGLSALSNIDDKYFSDMFKTVLDPTAVIKLRNEYMQQSEGLIEACIQQQHTLTKQQLQQKFNANMDTILLLLVKRNPVYKFLSKFPQFDADMDIQPHELALWTEYAFAGGDKPVAFIDDGQMIVTKACNDTQYKLPQAITTPPKLHANYIDPINTVIASQHVSPHCLQILVEVGLSPYNTAPFAQNI